MAKKDPFKEHKEQGKKRSNKWPSVRKMHLKTYPKCAVCGGTKKIEVHHKLPFHNHPELELDLNNLITLCEGAKDVNCHLLFGHLGSFRSYNKDVVEDSNTWFKKVKNRPQ